MYDKGVIDIEYGIQVVFSTVPNQKDYDFEKDIEKNYFKDYKEKIESNDNFLYKPLKFYILGDYDVCYISLINNFKFSHRLFEPKSEEDKTVYNAHSFQSYSGFALNEKASLEGIFSNNASTYFIGVINLKLNNGLLIGNGLKFIEAVYKHLKSILGDTPFIISQTFSWFEISLIVFINNPIELTDVLCKIRMSEFKDLNDEGNLTDSLYHELYNKKHSKTILNTSLFADTHTYFGFNDKLITNGLSNPYVKGFMKFVEVHNIDLETEIEWQVKPGHIFELEDVLKSHKYLKASFKFDKKKIVLGKCDYMLQEGTKDIMSNFHLIRYIHRKNECELYRHIRKVRTYVFLDGEDINIFYKKRDTFFLWDNELDKLAVKSREFAKVDKQLKSLKVSRQVRIKILKIFSNYNNGIQDAIQFPYFLDFTIFIKNLIKLINENHEECQSKVKSIKELETLLNEHIKVFQEGYNVRFLNGYQFENISDFDLDFNSSIQQLLTSYGTLVYEYGKLFYTNKNKPYYPIIQLNNIDTVSNYLSINYAIHHLTSPEFVFSTLLKEILNHLQHDNDNLKKELFKLKTKLKSYLEIINESYLDDIIENGLLDFNYLIIDGLRYLITFNGDFELFEHWFWSYNFQNPSLFDTSGMFNEDHLRKEMLRILLVKNFYEVDYKLINPTPELYNYWDRHYGKVEKISHDLIGMLKEFKFDDIINAVTFNYLENYKNDIKSHPSILLYMDKIEKLSVLDKSVKERQWNKLSRLFSGVNAIKEVLDLDILIFDTLKYYFEKNQKKVTLLKRNWDDGTVLKNFNNQNKEILFSIDQTGGVYFYDNEKINDYFKENANQLLSLIDFSFINKKKFILEQQYE